MLSKRIDDGIGSIFGHELFWADFRRLARWLQNKAEKFADQIKIKNLRMLPQRRLDYNSDLIDKAANVDEIISHSKDLMESQEISRNVEPEIKMMEHGWEILKSASREKNLKLSNMHESNVFEIKLNEFSEWVNTMTSILSSDYYDNDRSSVNELLKNLGAFEIDIGQHTAQYREIEKLKNKLSNTNPIMSEAILHSAIDTLQRFELLPQLFKIRQKKLKESSELYEILLFIEIKMDFLLDSLPLANSKELGNDLSEAQKLFDSHETFEVEISKQKGLISNLIQRCQQMIESRQCGYQEIAKHSKTMELKLSTLIDTSNDRRLLLDAIESRMFQFDEELIADNSHQQ